MGAVDTSRLVVVERSCALCKKTHRSGDKDDCGVMRLSLDGDELSIDAHTNEPVRVRSFDNGFDKEVNESFARMRILKEKNADKKKLCEDVTALIQAFELKYDALLVNTHSERSTKKLSETDTRPVTSSFLMDFAW